jgi:NAD-dependent SIR2 family protein deacetylase
MKPSALLFGVGLDSNVLERVEQQVSKVSTTEVFIVVGMSLSVESSASISEAFPQAKRVVVNRDLPPKSKDFQFGNDRDFMLQGNCDEIFFELAARLGWLPDLEKFRNEWCEASQKMFAEALKRAT